MTHDRNDLSGDGEQAGMWLRSFAPGCLSAPINQPLFNNLRTLLHHPNLQPLYFQPLAHSLMKTTGVGGGASLRETGVRRQFTYNHGARKQDSATTTLG